jgi:HEPN domain-containing protein
MYNTDILLNDFAIRSFRDVADCDYIAARLSFRAQLVPQFLWQSLQAIEKYLKCILVLNRIKAPRSHDLSKLLDAFEQSKKFEVRLSPDTHKFLQYLDTYGRFRYYETPYYVCVRPTHLAPDLNGWCARQRMVYAAIDSR